jgi:ribosome biogenesis GTPase
MSRRRLSERQQAAVAARQQRLADADEAGLEPGRVLARHAKTAWVEDGGGQRHECLISPSAGAVVCGDAVRWRRATDAGRGHIAALLPRRGLLQRAGPAGPRPVAANLSRLVIVNAAPPGFNLLLLDQLLAAARAAAIMPLLVINKQDLLQGGVLAEAAALESEYQAAGCTVLRTCAKTGEGLDRLAALLQDETSLLMGVSGAGKTSLARSLLPGVALRVGELSGASGQGRHTTSTTVLYPLPQGGWLMDAPGVRAFDLALPAGQPPEQAWPELAAHAGHCRFKDCRHRHEPDCALRAAVQTGAISAGRLQRFLTLTGAAP